MMRIIVALISVLFISQEVRAQPYWDCYMDTGRVVDFDFYESVIWCATDNAVVRWHRDTGTFKTYHLDTGLAYGGTCSAIEVDSAGTVWVLVNQLLAVKNNSSFSFVDLKDIDSEYEGLRVAAIHIADNDILYVGTNNGLYSFSDNVWTHVVTPSMHNVTAITSAPDGRLIIAAAGDAVWKYAARGGMAKSAGDPVYTYGVYVLDNSALTELRTFMPDYRFIRDVRAGMGNHVYGVGDIDGLVYYDGLDWDVIGAGEGLVSRDVVCVAEVYDGTVFIGTGTGLNHMVETAPYIFKTYTMDDGLPSNNILSIKQAPDGDIWIGTDRGLCRFDGVRFESHHTSEMHNSDFSCFTEDHQGRVWIGSRTGLSIYDHGEWNDVDLFAGRSIAHLEAHEETMWLVTGYTLARYHDGSWTTWDCLPGYHAPFDKITAIDTNGNFWFGSGDVLCFPARGEDVMTFPDEGNCKHIVADRFGSVWTVEMVQNKHHVYKYSGGKKKYMKVISQYHLYDFEYDGFQGVWAVSHIIDGGKYYSEIRHITDSGFERYYPGNGLDTWTEDVFVDKNGNAWCMAVKEHNELMRFVDGRWEKVMLNGNDITDVTHILSSPDSSLWVVVDRHEVLRYDGEVWHGEYNGDMTFITASPGIGDSIYLQSGDGISVLSPAGELDRYQYPSTNYQSRHGFMYPCTDGSVWYLSAKQGLVHVRMSAEGVDAESDIPRSFPLSVHPNPFNPSTSISFVLSEASQVDVSVYAVTGQKVCVLANTPFSQGSHVLRWNGVDMSGDNVASGVYMILVRAGDMVASAKVALVR